jgi:hypothetical protein
LVDRHPPDEFAHSAHQFLDALIGLAEALVGFDLGVQQYQTS